MKKNHQKLTLSRDTVRNLTGPALSEVAGGGVTTGCLTTGCTINISCGCTNTCLTAGCPTRQADCTALC